MAIDPRIPLQVQQFDLPSTFLRAEQVKSTRKQNELFDLKKEEFEADKPTRDALRLNKEQESELKSIVLGAERLRGFVQNEDLEGGLNYLQNRRDTLADRGINVDGTKEAIRQIEHAIVTGDMSELDTTFQRSQEIQQRFPGLFSSSTGSRFSKGQAVITKDEQGNSFIEQVVFNQQTGQASTQKIPIANELVSKLGESPTQETLRSIFEATEKEAGKQAEVTEAIPGQEAARGAGKREQEFIDVGQRQADATGIIRRGLELLEVMDTGKPEQIALAARNLFGIAGAEETELNANLGKAILSQLRTVFGAQFTVGEGDRLEGIEANFGKSTAGNVRLLKSTLKLMERDARRGIDSATKAGDTFAAEEIQKALDFVLTPEEPDEAPQNNKVGRFIVEEITGG